MKNTAQRLRALDADLAGVKAERTAGHRRILLRTISLMPHTVQQRVGEWRALWLSQPVEIERQMAEVVMIGPDPMSEQKHPELSRWIMAVAATPDNDLPPVPPAGVRTQLEGMSAEWRRAAREQCAGHPDRQRAAWWWEGCWLFYACLAQVLESPSYDYPVRGRG